MDTWKVRLNSDECPYYFVDFESPKGICKCTYPGNSYGKECNKSICPVAVPTPAAPNSEGMCLCGIAPTNKYCPIHGDK